MSSFPTDPAVNSALLLFDSHSEFISMCTTIQKFCKALKEYVDYSIGVDSSAPESQSFSVLPSILYQTMILYAILENLQQDKVNGWISCILAGNLCLGSWGIWSLLLCSEIKNCKQILKKWLESSGLQRCQVPNSCNRIEMLMTLIYGQFLNWVQTFAIRKLYER